MIPIDIDSTPYLVCIACIVLIAAVSYIHLKIRFDRVSDFLFAATVIMFAIGAIISIFTIVTGEVYIKDLTVCNKAPSGNYFTAILTTDGSMYEFSTSDPEIGMRAEIGKTFKAFIKKEFGYAYPIIYKAEGPVQCLNQSSC